MKKIFFSLIALATFSNVTLAQNTFPATGAAGIGTSTPNAASLLDITSTTKGVLIPRMTKVQRDAIITPVEGLMVYQTNSTPGFYFFDGDSWEAVAPKGATKSLGNLTAPTKVDIDLLPATDNSVSIGSAAVSWKDANFGGNANFDGKGYFLGGLNVGSFSNQTAMVEITPSSAAALRLNAYTAGSATGEMQMMETTANGFNYVGFKAPTSILANKIWTLPAADGTNGQVLSTNGAGVLSWVTGTGGGAETDPQVGTISTHFIPRWDGTALVTGNLKDTLTSITNGNYSKKGKLTIYRNGGLIVDDGVSAVQGVGTTSVGGSILSKGFLAAKDLNELVDQQFFPPFSSSLDHAGVLGYITSSASADGSAVVGLNSSTAGTSYGLYGISNGSGSLKYGSFSKAVGDGGAFGLNYGTYGEASGAVANFGVYGNAVATSASVNTYGVYGTASGTTGSVYAGYFAGDVHVTEKLEVNDWIEVADSMHVDKALVVGTGNRPIAYEFAVTGGADAYIDDVLSVNTTTATAQLNVSGSNETVLIEGTTPYIKLKDGANQSGFVQASGNDLRLGTLSGNSAGKLVFRFNGVDKNGMDVNGRFGLGTISPSALFHLKGTDEVMRIEGTAPFIQFYNGATAKSFIWSTGNDLKIGISTGNNTGRLILGTAGGGDQVFLDSDGTVGIGTSDTKGYKLGVDGSIVCEELKVKLSQNWPDYVFADDYKLPSLKEVENSIQQNKHLPGIPSAKEIHEEGINVGEMQKLLMQKIEELTLYVIDLEKKNNQLESKVTALENK